MIKTTHFAVIFVFDVFSVRRRESTTHDISIIASPIPCAALMRSPRKIPLYKIGINALTLIKIRDSVNGPHDNAMR